MKMAYKEDAEELYYFSRIVIFTTERRMQMCKVEKQN
jgi:hypothetical protein